MSTPQNAGQGMSAAFIEQIRQKIQPGLDAIYQRKTPVTTTSLPTSARDGDTYRYKVPTTTSFAQRNATWVFVYDASDAYWYAQGVQPLVSEIDTAESTASGAYIALTTNGPTITIPFAGDYLVSFGVEMSNTTLGVSTVTSFDAGGSSAVDADWAIVQSGTASPFVSVARARVKTLTAGAGVTLKYKVGGGTGTFQNRWLNVLPLRVH